MVIKVIFPSFEPVWAFLAKKLPTSSLKKGQKSLKIQGRFQKSNFILRTNLLKK
jgi:hypothetical protein